MPLLIRGPGIPAGAVSDELVSNLDVTQTILQIATGATSPAWTGARCCPSPPIRRCARPGPILLEADTGPGQGNAVDPEAATAASAKVAKAHLAGRKGVKDLDQEPMANKSAANGSSAPAYRAIRTDRYLYVLYANGQSSSTTCGATRSSCARST